MQSVVAAARAPPPMVITDRAKGAPQISSPRQFSISDAAVVVVAHVGANVRPICTSSSYSWGEIATIDSISFRARLASQLRVVWVPRSEKGEGKSCCYCCCCCCISIHRGVDEKRSRRTEDDD